MADPIAGTGEDATGLLRIGLLQLPPDPDPERNRRRGMEACVAARDRAADIALLPELFGTGGAPLEAADARDLRRWLSRALSPDADLVCSYADLAARLGIAIALPYLERTADRPRNSVSVFDRHGRLALHYSKVHTCRFDWERELEPGEGFPVAEIDIAAGPVAVGCMICFDREFPESARLLMLAGAELILVPNACRMEANRSAQLLARAFENMLALALANEAGADSGGGSLLADGMAFDADGRSRDMCRFAAGPAEGVYVAALDLAALRDYRRREVWGDAYRRPRLYGVLVDERPRPPFVRPDAAR